MDAADAPVQVRITADGTCFIDDEFFPSPTGASLNEAVLAHLQLEAAAAETPVRALIRDEQANYTMAIQVNSDGTSQPIAQDTAAPAPPSGAVGAAAASTEPPAPPTPQLPAALLREEPYPTDRPHESLPEPYRARLEAVCGTAREQHFAKAAADADRLISDLAAQYGPIHLYTLTAGSVRGDIAWLVGDLRYALQIWTFIAKAWDAILGPTHKTTVLAVGNAVGCWRRLSQPEALAEGDRITALLQEVPVSVAGPTLRAVGRRRQRLAAMNY